MQERTLFCFGLGYSARHLVQRLSAQGWRVTGTVRSRQKAQALAVDGIEALIFDGQARRAEIAAALSRASHILSSVPPGEAGDPVLIHHRRDIAEAVAGGCRWVGYLSTTGVYGDHEGGWVDEATPVDPLGERSKRRVRAEQDWADLRIAEAPMPLRIFRLSGIYGPGRSALDRLRAGAAQRVEKPGHVFNRIHVTDIAATLDASMAESVHAAPATIYNLADDEPAPGHEVIAYAARLMGIEPPPLVPFEEADLSEMAQGFYAANKRISNRRIKETLGVTLTYPTYRDGLRAQWVAEAEGSCDP